MSKNFEDVYTKDVLEALEKDRELDFKKSTAKYLSEGICPNCEARELYIAKDKPYKLVCNRLNNCGFSQNTRERYPEIFESFSDRFPQTPENPNAAADAYLSKVRGLPIDKIKGLYIQAKKKIDDGSMADVVQFKLANGHWSRLMDNIKIKANSNKKAKIDYGTDYQHLGWMMPDLKLIKGGKVFITEGIFDAISLTLAGYPAIAGISANNFPWTLLEGYKDLGLTIVLAQDNDEAGHDFIFKYHRQLSEQKIKVQVALPAAGEDWNEVFKAGRLNEEYIKKSLYRGSLLVAHSKNWKAYLIYGHTRQAFYLLDYQYHLYTVKVDVVKLNEDLNKEDYDDDFTAFKKHVTITQICNCIPIFKYIEKDSITGEQWYFFNFKFPNKKLNCTEPLAPSSINSARGFSQATLERTPGGNFEGTDKVLGMLRGQWLKNVITVKTLSYIGYDEETGVYCFNSFGYLKGKRLTVNKDGYMEAGHEYIKTNLKSNVITESKNAFNTDWFIDFCKVHHLNGLTMLVWWTASLFTQQIKRRHSSWPFLELTGKAGAGKSGLLRFLWKLYGREHEGTKPGGNGSSTVGLRRTLSQVSNMPVVLIESDQEKITPRGEVIIQQYNWDELKDLFDYNGILRATGVKNNSNDTVELIFKGSICISQNNSIEASEAILTRIVHLDATLDHHTPQLKAVANKLKELDIKFLAGYLEHVLQHESQWLTSYFAAYPKYEQELQKEEQIIHPRIVQNHAQLMAAAVATQQLFKTWSNDMLNKVINYIKERAIDRQRRLSKEPDAVGKFWDAYHYLNDKYYQQSDEKGELQDHYYTDRLNHSPKPHEEIAINLEQFTIMCNNNKLFISPDIKKLLHKSSTYAFIENKVIRSRLEKRSMRCWIFAKPIKKGVITN